MNIFLDDRREAPRGFETARDCSEFERLIRANKGNIEEISFDYHLDELKTGYSAAKWLVENNMYDGIKKCSVHTNDTVGMKMILKYLDEYLPKDVVLSYKDIYNNDVPYERENK
jgi:hypothetical protein